MIGWWLAGLAWGEPCMFEVDGEPTERLDCSQPGAWQVTCALPVGTTGRLRARLVVPDRRLVAEVRLPLSTASSGELALPVMGPSGRAGAFVVDQPVGGLLPGQAVGPIQLCPMVQPGVEPGAPPRELEIEVRILAHQQTGYAEEPLAGGVVNRVPVYGEGVQIAAAHGVLVQRPVSSAPAAISATELPRYEEVQGKLTLRRGDAWASFGWIGALREVRVTSGNLALLVLDFDAAAVEEASGAPSAERWLEQDLSGWAKGDPASLLGLAAWRRSGLPVPAADDPVFDDVQTWRKARVSGAELRIGRQGDQVRVVIAHRPAPLDRAAVRALDEASAEPW